mmetsp:Transcript_128719/g.222384  ORF Transcript_128719/g.222384 Transcript_128719/m.222384 type:complete len:560 (+) Transcript_128719:3479-5158(+)
MAKRCLLHRAEFVIVGGDEEANRHPTSPLAPLEQASGKLDAAALAHPLQTEQDVRGAVHVPGEGGVVHPAAGVAPAVASVAVLVPAPTDGVLRPVLRRVQEAALHLGAGVDLQRERPLLAGLLGEGDDVVALGAGIQIQLEAHAGLPDHLRLPDDVAGVDHDPPPPFRQPGDDAEADVALVIVLLVEGLGEEDDHLHDPPRALGEAQPVLLVVPPGRVLATPAGRLGRPGGSYAGRSEPVVGVIHGIDLIPDIVVVVIDPREAGQGEAPLLSRGDRCGDDDVGVVLPLHPPLQADRQPHSFLIRVFRFAHGHALPDGQHLLHPRTFDHHQPHQQLLLNLVCEVGRVPLPHFDSAHAILRGVQQELRVLAPCGVRQTAPRTLAFPLAHSHVARQQQRPLCFQGPKVCLMPDDLLPLLVSLGSVGLQLAFDAFPHGRYDVSAFKPYVLDVWVLREQEQQRLAGAQVDWIVRQINGGQRWMPDSDFYDFFHRLFVQIVVGNIEPLEVHIVTRGLQHRIYALLANKILAKIKDTRLLFIDLQLLDEQGVGPTTTSFAEEQIQV